ncbi:MAG: YgjV family protein, partial [Bacilli bacterium]|nr:YgjV family protein [Bacilli bacterium]
MFGALAVATMFFSYLNTKKDKYLLMQTLCNVFFAIQFYLVNALSAAVVCIITIFKS